VVVEEKEVLEKVVDDVPDVELEEVKLELVVEKELLVVVDGVLVVDSDVLDVADSVVLVDAVDVRLREELEEDVVVDNVAVVVKGGVQIQSENPVEVACVARPLGFAA